MLYAFIYDSFAMSETGHVTSTAVAHLGDCAIIVRLLVPNIHVLV